MKKQFKCSCGGHLLEIDYNNVIEFIDGKTKKKYKENIPEIHIAIYEIYGQKRKLKKPKLMGDVLFLGNGTYAKEMDFLMKFLDDISLQYAIRKK